MSSSNFQASLVQPWAKAYPLCRPPEPNNKEDARRFAREFPEACGEVDADKDHMISEVLNHMHPGGTDPRRACACLDGGAAQAIGYSFGGLARLCSNPTFEYDHALECVCSCVSSGE